LPFPNLTTEIRLFDNLGLLYKEPFERNYFDNVVSKNDGETVASLCIDDKQEFYGEQRLQKQQPYYYDYLDD